MNPLKGALTTPNKTANQKNTKKGLISWKIKTKQANTITMLH